MSSKSSLPQHPKSVTSVLTPNTDIKRRERLILHNVGIWSHYVGDASQPLHVSIYYNGWDDFPNPNGYTDSKKIHAYFEGAFVKTNLSRSWVASVVGRYKSCGCSIEQQTRT